MDFHLKNKKMVTLSAVRPPARFGAIKLKGNLVKYFKEKSKMDEGWINGGFCNKPRLLTISRRSNLFGERTFRKNYKKKTISCL